MKHENINLQTKVNELNENIAFLTNNNILLSNKLNNERSNKSVELNEAVNVVRRYVSDNQQRRSFDLQSFLSSNKTEEKLLETNNLTIETNETNERIID